MSKTRAESGVSRGGTPPIFGIQVSSAVAAAVLWLVVAAAMLVLPISQTQMELRAGVVRPLASDSVRLMALQACRQKALQRLNRGSERADISGSSRVVDLGNGRLRVETQLPSNGPNAPTALTCVVTPTGGDSEIENPDAGWIFERLSQDR